MSYSTFFNDNLWLSCAALLLLLLSTLGGLLYMRWHNRHVILPTQETQRQILENDAFNQTLIQTAPVALCLIARDNGHLLFANALGLDWLDTTPGQPLKNTEAMAALLNLVQYATQDGTIERFDISSERTLYVTYAPTRYKQQDAILCAFTDVTSHAEVERNLIRARKAANDADEAKTTFLATMSHEIRTPLYGALGTLELLSMTQLNSQQRQYAERIEDASQMLLQIISNILDINKIRAGQLQLEQTTFNPRELVQNCTSTYAGMAYRKGLLLFSTVTTDVPVKIAGDPAKLRQILNNLISNAIKFTETGFIIVRLGLIENVSSRPRLLLEVCDSGIGISKHRQEKLFTPFYLADTEHNIAGGAGLGLSICARLAELMNTKIQFRSEPMMGSRFFFELEFRRLFEAPPVKPELHKSKVWVRTPHPELTENICAWLNQWGARATAVDEIPEAIDASAVMLDVTRRPHNVTVDWQSRYLELSLSGETGPSGIDAYCMSSIGFGIDRLIRNKAHIPASAADSRHAHLRIPVTEDDPPDRVTLQLAE
ncbi:MULTISPECIES: ATP-binding protein [unclassified Serratia (in: enterobacteria)]|uniref:ATP-binding protein n=1 Tax=unclassified Serratia (in: enterobacteria) TaxID=2647522 RepID=UPI000691EDBF|nr:MULTISPECIES: ATP-binding protein [unclassified Serratia (in: enterobacteria)]